MPDLNTKLRDVIGDKTAKLLASQLELHTVADLLHHYPRRHVTRGELTDLSALTLDEHVTITAQVRKISRRPMRNKRGSITEVVVGDGHHSVLLTFFNQPWRERELEIGRWGLFAGKVGAFKGNRQLLHPDFRLLPADDAVTGERELDEFAGELVAVYPATKDVASWVISRAVRLVLDTLEPPADPVPDDVLRRRAMPKLPQALRSMHRPTSLADLDAARTRLAFDEALAVQLVLARRRAQTQSYAATPRPVLPGGLLAGFDAVCPFPLTQGQREVGAVIAAELTQTHPMHRLLHGEVGSGKTIVALRAMLQVVDTGGQAALLAPTEVLAMQHFHTIRALLGPLGCAGELGADLGATSVTLLTGSLSASARRAALSAAAAMPERGGAGIVVGTHALLQDTVELAELGLVVVDEQHRFGVEQRDALRSKAASAGQSHPHVLVMTATPIPRTIAMTVFGDLDTSALTQLPAGRAPISSSVVPVREKPAWLERAWQRIREEVAKGHQAYVVCPRIGGGGDASDADDGRPSVDAGSASEQLHDDVPPDTGLPSAVLELAPMLAEGPLAQLRVGVLHGRLPSEEKDAVMTELTRGKLDVLVATTIVEVGVDVPNATVMVIVDAGRFGVSQLHQLRGRIGRGSAPSLCLLLTMDEPGSAARTRLDAVASTTDGFALAELDMEQRAEGDVLGVAQSGQHRSLKLLSLRRDGKLIGAAREEAAAVVAVDPQLHSHAGLAELAASVVDDEQAEYLEKA
ncbi:MAG: ATP-dependent DNA helicase RecG [Acidimicrobiales bacterium]|nr:MAG: ATP-dependent DNA helicase RecG [Acidimicrobiales bacterium]